MAKRRHRIVHEADLASKSDTALQGWGIADEWQLIMWVTAVPTFYWLLRSQLEPDNEAFRATYRKFRQGMDSVITFGQKLIIFGRAPRHLRSLLQRTQELKDAADSAIQTLLGRSLSRWRRLFQPR